MSCAYVFQRGPKKGTVCTTRLCEVSRVRGLCGVHCAETREKGRAANSQRAAAASARRYKVTVDNSDKLYKKTAGDVVVREVREARALQLKKMGAVVEPI